ncbi:MAG: hypothetical protein BGO76_00230 [Caedibacter sp. 38-128]|nr:hypothetical protein [Holosporales bacterium]OJX05012.1 MAG: hypothetical protein BGO76_00230 [Caedibacter sp. 38-128]
MKEKEGRKERPLLYLAAQIGYENCPSLIAFTRAGFVPFMGIPKRDTGSKEVSGAYLIYPVLTKD